MNKYSISCFCSSGVVEYWEKKNIRCMGSIVNLSAEKLYYREALGIAYLTDTVVSD